MASETTEIQDPVRSVKLSQVLVWVSAAWSLSIMALVTLQFLGIVPPARFSGSWRSPSWQGILRHVSFGGAHFAIMGILIAAHLIVMAGVRRHRYFWAVPAAILLLLLSIVTGFTVGIYIFPSAVLLAVAIVLSMRR